MELIVKPYTMPKVIEFNFDELKTALTEKVQEYEIAIYSDDQIKQAKADKAALNKLKKALNDERIRMEKEYMVPFSEFKNRVNEIIGIIDKPIMAIDTQVKAYEEKTKQEKAQKIYEYMDTFSLPYGIDLKKIFTNRWLNTTVSMASIKKEIEERITYIEDDLKTLETVEDYQDIAIACYKETIDLREALSAVARQKQLEEKQKAIMDERLKRDKQEPASPEPPKAPEPAQEPVFQWVSFEARLTNETALKLKKFFTENGIEFRRI